MIRFPLPRPPAALVTNRALWRGLALASLLVSARASEKNLGDWLYSEDLQAPANAGNPVTIPHTWNAHDVQSGKGTGTEGLNGYRRAPGRYVTVLRAEDLPAGKRVFARFEGVSSQAAVTCDGTPLGVHRGPGTAFAFELTKHLARDGSDTLSVVADNTWRDDLAPLSGDFGVAGGIYRPAHLVIRDTVCFSPLVDGDEGARVSQLMADATTGEIAVRAHVDNAGASPAKTSVKFVIRDAAGSIVASKTVDQAVPSGASEISETLAVASPTLWDGVANPYLYTLELSLASGDGSSDRLTLPIGFRTFRIDPKAGFFLNGKPYPLRGVNRHQDRDGQLWAITAAQEREDAAMIAEIGANVVRCAHYPHSRTFLDACDRLGLLVWAEEPVIDTTGPNPEGFFENMKTQLREMIAQQGHHACVFTWSLFNEVGRIGDGGKDHLSVLKKLNDVAHAEDPTRPTAAATNQYRDAALNSIPDIIALNAYPGWYGGDPKGDLSPRLAEFRRTAPGKAWGVSEYGAGASLSQQDDTIAKAPKPAGKWHPEAWQCRVHENALASIRRHPELWGTFVWNMFDFASSWRTEGERDGINDKGLVTYDRKTRKDAFYLYQANWSKTPVLHLLARRDDKRKSADTVIRYYTNLKEVAVSLNGANLTGAKPYAPDGYVIPDIKLRPGKNTVTATALTADGATVTDTLEWTLVTP